MNLIINLIFLILSLFYNLTTRHNFKIIVIKNDYSCNPCFKKLDDYFLKNRIKFYYNYDACENLSYFKNNDLFLKKNMPNGSELGLKKLSPFDSISCFISTPYLLISNNYSSKLIKYNQIFDSNMYVNENLKDLFRFDY